MEEQEKYLTVGMIFPIFSAQQNMVSSRKLLCSLYGTE